MIVGFHPMFKHLYLQLGGIDNLLKHHKKQDFIMAAKINSPYYPQQILSDFKKHLLLENTSSKYQQFMKEKRTWPLQGT